MVTSSEDTYIRMWDQKGTLLKVMKDHKDFVNVAKWNKESSVIATAGCDKRVLVSLNILFKLWDKEGKLLRSFNFNSRIHLLDWKNNVEFVTCDNDNLTFWNIDLDKPERQMKAHESTVTALSFDPSGTLLATCSEDSLVKVRSL